MDLDRGRRWTLRPNPGRIPWWVLSRKRRAPGTHATDHLALLRLRRISDDATVAASLRKDAFYQRLVEPLAVAALNTPPDVALVRLLGAVMRETLFRGGGACIPAVPREGLSESLVDPAVAWLEARGCTVITGRRVAGLWIEAGKVSELATADGPMPVEAVVLAAAALGRRRPAARPGLSDRVPGDPEHPLPGRGGSRAGRVHRPGGRHRGMGVRQARAMSR